METPACNLCGSAATRLRHTVRVDDSSLRFYRYARRAAPDLQGTLRMVECAGCGLCYLSPRLDAGQLARVYGDNRILSGNWRGASYLFRQDQPDDLADVRAGAEHFARPDLHGRFELLRRHGVSERAAVLDVGCGRGEFVRAALERGFDAFGVDLSADRVAQGHAALDLDGRVLHGAADDLLERLAHRRFDAITLWDVVEHLPDPRGTLAGLAALCHPDTKLFVQTMSLDSTTYRLFGKRWYYVHPVHLYYFSHATMARLLELAGFDPVAVEHDGSRPPTPLRLLSALLKGLGHRTLFRIYGPRGGPWRLLRPLLRPWQGGISDERMQRRVENLYPGHYAGRLRDVFVFVARPAAAAAPARAADAVAAGVLR